ncbi:MAG: radical SAM protein [Dehalococcoidia bacterium]
MKTESVYWVFTHNCNLKCAHCYNDSRPGAPTITRGEADAVLANLPEETNRFILSGGEPLAELEMCLYLLAAGRERYPAARVLLQTNGDLLDGPTLERLLATGLDGISICSLDAFHPRPDGKFEALRELMTSAGMVERRVGDPGEPTQRQRAPEFSIWGATPELWVGGLWPRGRAMKYGLAQMVPEHNFCDRWSGALGFLDNGSSQQEIAIQLTTAYPCCPGTVEPLGDLTAESVESMLDRRRGDPVWEALNGGDPASMGVDDGFDREYALRRIEQLGSVCLWCDEFFAERAARRGERVEPLVVRGEIAVAAGQPGG